MLSWNNMMSKFIYYILNLKLTDGWIPRVLEAYHAYLVLGPQCWYPLSQSHDWYYCSMHIQDHDQDIGLLSTNHIAKYYKKMYVINKT